jgi:hypothetical protein
MYVGVYKREREREREIMKRSPEKVEKWGVERLQIKAIS